MPYTPFAVGKPVITDTGTQVVNDTRNNLAAVRDAIITGAMKNWAYAFTAGTAEQPTTVVYSNGTERLRKAITWGTTGGAQYNIQSIVYSYSSNNGSSYDTIGTQTFTYDASGDITGVAWT